MKKNKFAGWYYDCSRDYFGGIFYSKSNRCKMYREALYLTGPFDTFEEAKAAVLDYYAFDLLTAKQKLKEVKAFKKPKE